MDQFQRDPDPIRPCGGPCGRLTRPARMPLAEAPGTAARHSSTHCQKCHRAVPGNGPSPERQAELDAEKEAQREAGYAAAFRARAAFEAQRRARLGRASRRMFV